MFYTLEKNSCASLENINIQSKLPLLPRNEDNLKTEDDPKNDDDIENKGDQNKHI